MRIQVTESLPLSADEVFHLIRDDMPALVPFLYEITRIEVTDRKEGDGTVELVNHWYGDMTKIPGPVRKFVSQDLLSWADHASWSTAERKATWWLEPRIGAKVFECRGSTQVLEGDAESSSLVMDIHLEIHPERIPGVPKFLARKFHGQIESTIERAITPNMKNLAVSIRRYAASKTP